ncbi:MULTISPECIES: ROK family protein [Erwinia]|uniref:Glucokinase n=2 Tax=Erwinia TaxID=551 RepID=A0A014NRW8_9GAMM|nr:ROK family protein [Erwinia mallotivora]EXU76610.1 glucokinase [Erwinia mallotivora]
MTRTALLFRAGIDIGGTGTRIILLHEEREVAVENIPTAWFATLPQASRAGALVDKIRQLLPAGGSLVSLGIGASGPVNNTTEIIENNDTLTCFSYYPLVSQLRELLAVPVAIDNDAVAAALGEYHLGAGKGSKRMMMVTLGTGIGVALLNEGQPFRAADGRHPEAGHIPVSADATSCYCGLQGCWESLASRGFLQQKLEQEIADLQWGADTPALLQNMMVTRPRVAKILHQYGEMVGRGLNTLLALYGPDVTVLSGSAAALLPLFQSGLDTALNRADGYAVNRKISQSALGDAAGALGAAILPTLRGTRQP